MVAVGVGVIVGLVVGVAVGVAVRVGVIVGFLVGDGEATLLVTVASGVMVIIGGVVGVICLRVGVGTTTSLLGKNKLRGSLLILNIKKTPNPDKISKIMVNRRYLIF